MSTLGALEDTGTGFTSNKNIAKTDFVRRCEVSAEAPLFNTVSQSKRMQVVGRYPTHIIVISTNL